MHVFLCLMCGRVYMSAQFAVHILALSVVKNILSYIYIHTSYLLMCMHAHIQDEIWSTRMPDMDNSRLLKLGEVCHLHASTLRTCGGTVGQCLARSFQ